MKIRPSAVKFISYASVVLIGAVIGCGGGSGNSTGGSSSNPIPSVSSLAPTSVPVGSAATNLTVTGSGFVSTSQVEWNGTMLATTFVSASSLTAVVSTASLAAAGTASITVVSPTPGGGSSGALNFNITNPVPVLNGLSPTSVPVGSATTNLTVTGSGFASTSQVQWNGIALATTFVSATSLTAAVPATNLAAAGTASITVVNPTPGGGSSSALSFNITNPAPVLNGVSPASVQVGATGFNLTVTGSGFISTSKVEWNGTALATTFVSGSSLTAAVPTANLATAGTVSITIMNPTPGGGSSTALTFEINSAGNHLTKINTPVNHIVWDTTHGSLYATLPNTGANANSVAAIDPITATVGTPVAAGNTPDLLALSTDDSFLYVSLDGTPSIVRFHLPALTLDSSFNLHLPTSYSNGAETTLSMAVAPGSPHTIATIFGQLNTTPPTDGTFIYDDTTARASSVSSYNESSTSLVWGATASALYATDTGSSGADLFINTVNSTGVTLAQDYGGLMYTANGTLHFDPVSGNIYSDDGHVADPANGNLVGAFNLNSLEGLSVHCMPDVANNMVFFLGQNTTQFNAGSGVTILAFNATTYQLVDTLLLNDISGYPLDFVRWGNAGLAFTMTPYWFNVPIQSGPVYLLDGSFVSASAKPDFTAGTSVEPLPKLVSINPQAAVAGSSAVTLSVTGRNFEPGASVQWNGAALETTVTSASALQAIIPSSALGVAGNAVVTVSNGVDGSSTGALAFTITPASPGTTNLLIVNLASLDIAWDSTGNQLIAPVWSADPQYANSIVAINAATGAVTHSASVAADPTMARITSDSSYVYTGFKAVNQVTQLALPGLSAPSSFSLGADSFFGPWYALDLQPAPGAPLTTAVILGTNGAQPPQGSLTIYDNGTRLPNVANGFVSGGHPFNDLQWGANSSTLYADDNNSSFNFYTLAVNSSGVTLNNTSVNAFGATGSKIHFNSATGYIYDDNGQVINPATAAQVGKFNASGLLVADDTLGRVFILGQTTAQSGTANYTIQSFNQTTFAYVGSISITGVVGAPIAFTRWGANGLAFATYNQNASPTTGPAGVLYIVSDASFVSANLAASDGTPSAGGPR